MAAADGNNSTRPCDRYRGGRRTGTKVGGVSRPTLTGFDF